MLITRTAFVLGVATRALVLCKSLIFPYDPLYIDFLTYHSCAAINGIDPAIVSRANELTSLLARGENIVAACAVLSPGEMEELEEAVRTIHLSRSTA